MADALRIATLFPAATELVCGLGLQPQLVGVSHACGWPATIASLPRLTRSCIDSSASSGDIDRQVQALLQARAALYEVDAVLLAALQPDLVIAQAQCDVCAVSEDLVRKVLAGRAELSQTALLTLNPRSLAEALRDMRCLGAAAGGGDEAAHCVELLERRVIAASRIVPPSKRRPRVAVIEWLDPLLIAGNWTPELVELAGGEYRLAVAGAASPRRSWAEIIQYDPELLVVAPCGFGVDRSHAEARQLQEMPAWKSLSAVRAGRVFPVDGDAYFNCPGPRLVDSLELLSGWIEDLMI